MWYIYFYVLFISILDVWQDSEYASGINIEQWAAKEEQVNIYFLKMSYIELICHKEPFSDNHLRFHQKIKNLEILLNSV